MLKKRKVAIKIFIDKKDFIFKKKINYSMRA